MISRMAFARQLKLNKVPYYAYPKVEPGAVFDTYNFSILSGTRKISTENSSKFTRKSESYRVDKKTQQRIFNKVIKPTTEVNPYVLCVSSSVNDYLAHEVAFTMLLGMVRNYKHNVSLQWKCVTPKYDPSINSSATRPDVVIIRSVLPEKERLYQIRDLLDYYYNSCRIVVIGGVDGIDFFDNYLHHPLNGALHVEGYKGAIPKEFWVKDETNTVLDNSEFRYPVFCVDTTGKKILQNFKLSFKEED